ncbi:alcohol dehydrogenase catalytic domain-containing protein [Streptomyces sp. NPDC088252]|uniref:alcohol dehydrogenase catalytic domain-containing protein n=1 Tax=Streptomyces sp. NPDC088252 TaxID=3365845 RepID=UPI00380DB610
MIERRDVGPHDVRLDILYCGICHSDLNFTCGEFGPLPTSPLVPGHEVVGRLTETGTEVTRHQVGDLVGIGCVVNSCRDCENCRAAQEQYCGTATDRAPRSRSSASAASAAWATSA